MPDYILNEDVKRELKKIRDAVQDAIAANGSDTSAVDGLLSTAEQKLTKLIRRSESPE